MCDMTMSTGTEPSVEPRPRPGVRVFATVVIGVLALLVVALLLVLDKVQVQTQQELGHVAFGMPLSWVTQHQVIDPPLPWHTSFTSPWESPTNIDWLPLALNVVVVGLVLFGVWRAVLAVRSSRSTK